MGLTVAALDLGFRSGFDRVDEIGTWVFWIRDDEGLAA